MLKRFFLFKAVAVRPDWALLALRLITGISLFLRHGTEKLFGFHAMAAHFPDPLHIGPVPSLLFATLSDGICSLLLALGLFTRWAALVIFVNVGVVWVFVLHFLFFGRRGAAGELVVLYLAASLTLFLSGAGRYSIDAALDRKK